METANVKLAAVVSHVMGKSGRRMLAAIVEGVSDAQVLADLACGYLARLDIGCMLKSARGGRHGKPGASEEAEE